jgi:putative phosphoesterase
VRIGVVSDSHGNLYTLDKTLSLMGDLDMIIHLGDNYKDIIKLNEKYKKRIEYVTGNNDYGREPVYDKVINVEDKRIFMTHGHKYSVYFDLFRLQMKAQEENADVVLYGHTHMQLREDYNGIIYLNPGSTTFPRDRNPGGLVLIINNGIIECNFIRLSI